MTQGSFSKHPQLFPGALGDPVGTARVWGTLTARTPIRHALGDGRNGPNPVVGEMLAEFRDRGDGWALTLPGSTGSPRTAAERVTVEYLYGAPSSSERKHVCSERKVYMSCKAAGTAFQATVCAWVFGSKGGRCHILEFLNWQTPWRLGVFGGLRHPVSPPRRAFAIPMEFSVLSQHLLDQRFIKKGPCSPREDGET